MGSIYTYTGTWKTATAAAASATAPPRLVDKKNNKSRVWKYFAFGTLRRATVSDGTRFNVALLNTHGTTAFGITYLIVVLIEDWQVVVGAAVNE